MSEPSANRKADRARGCWPAEGVLHQSRAYTGPAVSRQDEGLIMQDEHTYMVPRIAILLLAS